MSEGELVRVMIVRVELVRVSVMVELVRGSW